MWVWDENWVLSCTRNKRDSSAFAWDDLPPLLSPDLTATSPRVSSELEQARPQTSGEEELQLQLALAMSREVAEQVSACVVEPMGSLPWCSWGRVMAPRKDDTHTALSLRHLLDEFMSCGYNAFWAPSPGRAITTKGFQGDQCPEKRLTPSEVPM
jgi:hypothetical protein